MLRYSWAAVNSRWAAWALAAFAAIPAWAGHAQILTGDEARRLEAMIGEAGTIRHFCAPCGDTAWREEKVREARGVLSHSPADEWTLLVDGNPVDAAYLYLRKGDRWVNAAALAGISFPDVPATLLEALLETELPVLDSSVALYSWSGLYRLKEQVYRKKAKHPVTLIYDLRIHDSGDSLKASLHVDGPGTTHRMALAGTVRGDSASLSLRHYLKENYGNPHAPGAWLFTLERTPGGGLATRWGGVKPRDAEAAKSGFRRIAMDPHQPGD